LHWEAGRWDLSDSVQGWEGSHHSSCWEVRADY